LHCQKCVVVGARCCPLLSVLPLHISGMSGMLFNTLLYPIEAMSMQIYPKHRGGRGAKSIRLLADQQISLRQQTHLEKTNFFSKVKKKNETNVAGCLKYLNRNLPAREKSLKVICQRGAMTAQPRPFPPPLDLSATTFVTLCLPFGCFSLSAKIKKKRGGEKNVGKSL